MITITANTLGLILAGIVIIVGLAGPMAKSEGDNGVGLAYAATIIIIAAMAYLMCVGLSTLI